MLQIASFGHPSCCKKILVLSGVVPDGSVVKESIIRNKKIHCHDQEVDGSNPNGLNLGCN